MSDRVTHEEMMRFLDGELQPEEYARVERLVASSSELRREVALFRAMKSDIQNLSFDPGNRRHSVWEQVNQRLTRPIGWLLVVVGVLAWMVYGTYLFATSSADPFEKLATGAIVIGVLLLLASVIWERFVEWHHDPYRDVHR